MDKQFWDGIERRVRTPAPPKFEELVLESSWRPTDSRSVLTEGHLVGQGLITDRRR